MIPRFGKSEADGKRDVLEGRLIWVALQAMRLTPMSTARWRGWRPRTCRGLRWPRRLTATGRCRRDSLTAIHAAGVVHRDLKPSNVLLAQDGPHVIDFGISRAAESTTLTRAGLVIGSPGFMSPEQATGGDIGKPTDIFSLGTVLAFAATGEGPFGEGTTAALLYRVVSGTPDLHRVPAAIRPLVERCLAKDPGQRPTAPDLLAEAGAVQYLDERQRRLWLGMEAQALGRRARRPTRSPPCPGAPSLRPRR